MSLISWLNDINWKRNLITTPLDFANLVFYTQLKI